jgi:N-acetylmuramoyl-L-alanine amidase CwlA
MNIIEIPSPNFVKGRRQFMPEAIVIHIMEGTLSGTDSWFRNVESKVSAHYGIGKNGEVHRYVQESDTAWHAGRVNAPAWSLIKPSGNGFYINPNFYTVGIEHEGNEESDWTDAMYDSSSALVRDICARWNIPLDRQHIIGHHEIYSLKTCPGRKVDLNKLIALAGGDPVAFIPPPPNPKKISQKGKATTKTGLNIRSTPSRNFAPIATVHPGVQLAYDGFTNDGEKINEISKWFFTNEGNWFWSGAVTQKNNIIREDQ